MTAPRYTQCKCGHPASAHAGEHCDPCCYPANGDKCRHDFAPPSAPARADEGTYLCPHCDDGWINTSECDRCGGSCETPPGGCKCDECDGPATPLSPPAAVEGADLSALAAGLYSAAGVWDAPGSHRNAELADLMYTASSAILALIAERDEAREDTRRINRLEHYGDAVLIGLDEPEYAGEPRFSFRDMATPPSRESLDGTLYGQTVREVLDAARRDGQ
jgi:hypothetical protein